MRRPTTGHLKGTLNESVENCAGKNVRTFRDTLTVPTSRPSNIRLLHAKRALENRLLRMLEGRHNVLRYFTQELFSPERIIHIIINYSYVTYVERNVVLIGRDKDY